MKSQKLTLKDYGIILTVALGGIILAVLMRCYIIYKDIKEKYFVKEKSLYSKTLRETSDRKNIR